MRRLGGCMEIGRDIQKIDLQLLYDLWVLRALASLPEGGAEMVTLDKVVLALEDQLAEAPLVVRLDRLHRERRREFAVGIARYVGAVGVRTVLVALFVHVQIA